MKTQRNAYYALFLCKIISAKKQCFCYKITNRMLQISQWENEVRAAQAGKKLENVRMRKWGNLEISKLTWVRRKKSVACATEILQIFKKNQTNRLQIVWKSRTDYTDCTDSLSFDNWQMWWTRIGNCVAGFHRLQCKHKCESVLYI